MRRSGRRGIGRGHPTILDGSQGGSVVTATQGGPGGWCTIDGFTIRNGKATRGGGDLLLLCFPDHSQQHDREQREYRQRHGKRWRRGYLLRWGFSADQQQHDHGQQCHLRRRDFVRIPFHPRRSGTIRSRATAPAVPEGALGSTATPLHRRLRRIALRITALPAATVAECTATMVRRRSPTTLFLGNSTGTAGGICCSSSSATIINNQITRNSASSNAGGIYCSAGSESLIIVNNTVRGKHGRLQRRRDLCQCLCLGYGRR